MKTSQEPVAWMYDFLNSDDRDEVIRNWITQDYADIEREKGFNVRPLYTTPQAPQPQRECVSLTEEQRSALIDARNEAMQWASKGRIPECGAFGGIAQNLDWLCDQLADKQPQREWVGLTDEEIWEVIRPLCPTDRVCNLLITIGISEYRAIEAKLKEKNGGGV
jgi:hypothetical protein